MRYKLVCDVCKKVVWIYGVLDTTVIPHKFKKIVPHKFKMLRVDPWYELCEHMHQGKFDVVDATTQMETIQ